MEKRNAGLGGLRSGEAAAALPRPQSTAPEDSHSNVITFRTPPSQRINDFDPTASALWPTWVALCGLSRNSGRKRSGGEGGQMKVTAIEVNLDLKSQWGLENPARLHIALIFHI